MLYNAFSATISFPLAKPDFYVGARAVFDTLDGADGLGEPQRHAVLAQVVIKRLNNFGIDKRKQPARDGPPG